MTKKQRVLVVDDEPRNQRIIQETLEDLVELKLASTGEEALSAVEEFMPDLILLDIMMPGLNGYQVCEKIKADPRFILTKIILVSGKAMLEERLKGYDSQADDYMTKPFVPEELLAKSKVFLKLTALEQNFRDLNESLDKTVQERTKALLETESKLIAAAKMSALGEMAGGIAHEINTPLGTISLLTDQITNLLGEEPTDREGILDLLKIIDGTVSKISTIIQGLRTFSRDGSKDQPRSAFVKQLIDDTLILCQEKMQQKGIQVSVNSFDENIHVLCRAVQISQVLLNLLNNACDAIVGTENPWIRISVEAQATAIQISVTDSGNGVPEKFRASLFHPFFTTKEIGKGTGLGLSISKGIVDAHKGELSLDTSCKNTRFVLSLPFENIKKELAS